MGQINYVHTVPNSHFYTRLEQLITSIEFDIKWQEEREERIKTADHPIVDMYEPLTPEYLIIGLCNSQKHGYEIKFNPKNIKEKHTGVYFGDIAGMKEYLRIYRDNLEPNWRLEHFKEILEESINNGYNLDNGIKMERTEVYKRLDTERDYQDLRWSPRREKNDTPDEEKPPAEWINYIEHHVTEAKREVYFLNDEEALAHVRKVAALAVRCLELHGCPERVIPEELLNEE